MRATTNKKKLQLILIGLTLLLAQIGLWAQAALAPEVEAGLQWLTQQVQADGRLSAEDASQATAVQARAETHETLSLAGRVVQALRSAVGQPGDDVTELLARRAVQLALAETPDPALLAQLATRQNADGGFGSGTGYASSPIDTAFALLAYSRSGALSGQQVASALGYLAASKNADGGWGRAGQSRVYDTAMVSLAASTHAQAYSVATTTSAAKQWLLSKRNADQRLGSVLHDALGLLALARLTSDAAVIDPLVQGLKSAQAPDGSWGRDPYLTALAVRALWYVGQAPVVVTDMVIRGKVLDAVTATPLAGATIQIIESPASNTSTDAAGAFSVSGLPAAAYTVKVAKLGYEQRQFSIPSSPGQAVDLGAVLLQKQSLTAALTGVVKDASGNALKDVIITVGTASVSTDTAGRYQLSGLPPGAASIAAQKVNYVTATATVNFEAGKTYNFSPTLYTGPAPTTATLRGKVTDTATGAALVGAQVTVAGSTRSTTSTGSFEFTGLSAGPFSASVTAAGYAGVTASGSLVNGINDIGTIALSKLPATSTVSGYVRDAASQAPLAGAKVTVVGTGLTATANSQGAYSLSGITSLAFNLSASVAGYTDQSVAAQLQQPGAASYDFLMAKTEASSLRIDSVATSKPEYSPYDELEIEVDIANSSSQAVGALVDVQIFDASGRLALELKANAHGLGEFPVNQPITLPAGATTEVEMENVMLRQPAGAYTAVARIADVSGRIIGERSTEFTLSSQAILHGAVVLDPPIAQAGTNSPVAIKADVGNLGNVVVPAGDLQLKVTLEHPDTNVNPAIQTSLSSIVSGAPLSGSRGMARDSAGNLFVANSAGTIVKITPGGAASVHYTIVSNALPSLSDVTIDAQGTLWLVNSGHGRVWSLTPAMQFGEFTLSSLRSVRGLHVGSGGKAWFVGQGGTPSEYRLVERDLATGAESILWAGGMSAPRGMVVAPDGDLVVVSSGDHALRKVSRATAAISTIATGLQAPLGVTLGSDGNYYVASSGLNGVWKVDPTGAKSVYATGLPTPFDLKFDAQGRLLVSAQGDQTIYRVPAGGGTPEVLARSVANVPSGLAYDPVGTLHIANGDGTLRALDASGNNVRTLATGVSTPRGVAAVGTDELLVASAGAGTIVKVSGGTKSTLVSGLSSPWGVAAAGSAFYVGEYGTPRVSQYAMDGSLLARSASAFTSPNGLAWALDGSVLVKSSSSTTPWSNLGGPVPVAFGSIAFDHLRADAVAGGYVAARSSTLYRLDAAGTVLKSMTLPFGIYGVAVDAAGRVIVGDYVGRRTVLVDIDAASTSTQATFTDNVRKVFSTRSGGVFALTTNYRSLKRVDADGSVVDMLPANYAEYISNAEDTSDAKVGFWTNSSRLNELDPATGAVVTVRTGISPSFALLSPGQIVLANSDNTVTTADRATGNLMGRVAGFAGIKGVAHDGSALYFVDTSGYLFKWVPGAYPERVLTGFAGDYLQARAGRLYASSGATVRQWDIGGASSSTLVSVSGTSLQGLAFDAQGVLTLADATRSRVLYLNATGSAVARQLVGLATPSGLAFDAQGRLYAGSNGTGIVARFNVVEPGQTPEVFSLVGSPQYMAFDAAGMLHVASSSGNVYQVNGAGAATALPAASTPAFYGVAISAGVVYAGDSSSFIRKYGAGAWQTFAAGLSAPVRVKPTAGGDLLVTNNNNGTLLAYRDGAIRSVATDLLGPNALVVTADNHALVLGSSGSGAFVDLATGAVSDVGISKLISGAGYGAVSTGASGFALLHDAPSVVSALTVSQPTLPPPAGTVVYQTSRPFGGLLANDDRVQVDFGTWVPPYGGDYKFELTAAGAQGGVQNNLHVGPFATGELAVDHPNLPPGDQTASLSLRLNGADFTSFSRVEKGLIRKVVGNERPSGMVGDRAGNVWYTNANSLNRVGASGVEPIVTGIQPAFGLAVDSNERFYLPVRNASTGRYDLLRVLTDGTKSVVADLGVTSANGVAVNSRDEVLVGSPGKLLRIDPQTGAVSVVTTVGFPSPRGIAIDGRDNVYVQNEGHIVSRVAPDGRVTQVFSGAAGDPQFEGDGYPNITADCADNFYIAPFNWAKIGQNNTEEHVIGQVIPRTGQVSAVFDTLTIDSRLTDIDYLAFDRFGSRILMWADYVNEIWQAPVTCGAIGLEAHLITEAGQTLSAFDRAPSASILLADGRTEYVWSLRDVTASGATIRFQTLLGALQLGEQRATLDAAFIVFKNSFSPQDITLPLEVPKVSVGNLVTLAETVDKPAYGANEEATIGVALTNPNPVPVGGDLLVEVYDTNKVLVGRVLQQGVGIEPEQGLNLNGLFQIGTTLPGDYLAVATLTHDGVVAARAAVGFQVVAEPLAATARSTLMLDKTVLSPTDQVRITSRALNLSANAILSELTLKLRVLGPAGNVLLDQAYAIEQLAVGALQEFVTPYALVKAPAGVYRVEQTLYAAGALIDSHAVSFSVQSTATTGAGLVGTLQALPQQLAAGEMATLGFSVTNNGNDALVGLPLTVNIVDPVGERIVASFPATIDVAASGTYAGNANWSAAGAVGSTYVAVLSAQIGERTLVLAQDNLSIVGDHGSKLALDANVHGDARLLVLVSCGPGADANGKTAPEDPGCVSARAQWLASFLAALGIEHHISTTVEDFVAELHCGRYDNYWVSGGTHKLGATAIKEVREAVRRGAGLLIDGTHDERNGLLDEVPGVIYRGKLPHEGYDVSAVPPIFPAGTLPSAGTALKYELAGGSAQATFPAEGMPAIVSRAFGQGHAMVYAFDLVGSLQTGSLQAGGWTDLFRAGLAAVVAAPPASVPGGAWVPLGLTITNQATQATTVIASAQLPAGVALEGTPSGATLDSAGNPVWQLTLAAGEARQLTLAVRAPYTTGTVNVPWQVAAVRDGVALPTETASASFTVQASDATGAGAVSAIQALAPTSSPQRNARNRAAADVQAGLALLSQAKYAEAMTQLLSAADELESITSVSTQSAAIELARLVAEAEHRQCDSLPLCQSSVPRQVNDGYFTPFAPSEGLQARGGDAGSWQWALGTDTSTVGAFTPGAFNWISGKSYGWSLTYDSAGNGSLNVLDGGTTALVLSFPATSGALRIGNAVQIGVRAQAAAGSAKLDAGVTRLQGQAVSGAQSTGGDGTYSEGQITYLLPAGALNASGTLKLTFPDLAPPAGDLLQFTVHAGSAACRAQ